MWGIIVCLFAGFGSRGKVGADFRSILGMSTKQFATYAAVKAAGSMTWKTHDPACQRDGDILTT